MNNTLLGAIAISLIIGAGSGYGFAQYKLPNASDHNGASDPAPVATSGKHTMDSSMTSMVDDLKRQTGEARDAAFLEGMMIHHQGAIEMAQIIAKSTKRPELKQMADTIISAQTAEIATMQDWLTQWFGR